MMQLRGSPLTQRLLFWLDEFQWLRLYIWRLRVRVLGLIDFHYTFHQLVADIEREMTTFLCSECGKRFTEKATLSVHQSRAHDKTSYSCDECDTDVIGKVALNHHKRRHKTPVVRNLQKKNKCDICPYESADKSHAQTKSWFRHFREREKCEGGWQIPV